MSVSVLVAGDFCPMDRVSNLIATGDYDTIFGQTKTVIAQSDYSIVNLECPIAESDDKAITKCGPNLKCAETVIGALSYAGFKCVTLANNHIRDFGSTAILSTVDKLRQNGIDYVGVGANLKEAARILYKEVSGKRLAIINCCEHEFSIATDTAIGANPLNPIQQFYAIKEARKNVDFVLVIVHGGHEHYQLPSPRMQETYRFFVDCGADVVINHHQHCYSGYEIYKGSPIFYGLGNFCFDEQESSSNGLWNEGYLVMLTLGDAIQFELFPYNQCGEKPEVKLLPNDSFNAKLKELNAMIVDEKALKQHTYEYYKSSRNQYSNIFEPIRNRYYLALKNRGLLPSLITKERITIAENYISCESHRDKLLYYLNEEEK